MIKIKNIKLENKINKLIELEEALILKVENQCYIKSKK